MGEAQPRRRKPDAPAMPFEERRPQPVFERCDPAADGTVGEAQLRSGPAERPLLCRGKQRRKAVERRKVVRAVCHLHRIVTTYA